METNPPAAPAPLPAPVVTPPSAAPAPAQPAPPVKMHKIPKRWPVVLIGIGKLLKSVGLVVITFVLRALIAEDQRQRIVDWVDQMRLEPHNELINSFLDGVEHATNIDPHTLRVLHIGVIIYAGLYLIEGLGLLFERKWAEWMVVVTTFGFLPFEFYEICREITWGRCLLFIANIVVLAYLIFRLHRTAVVNREFAQMGLPPPKKG